MQDKTLTCKDCGKQFTFTASEQEFYASKGFSDPVRCQDCRRKLKEQKQQQGGGRFNRQGRSEDREMHKIICANCGAEGEVPFKPVRPETILCADCFRKKRAEEQGMPVATPAPVAAANDDTADDSASDDMSNDDTASDETSTEESAE